MVYKKFIKRGGKKYGPYYYESYRDEKGKVKTRYLENYKPGGKKNKTVLIFVSVLAFLLIVVALGLVFMQTPLDSVEFSEDGSVSGEIISGEGSQSSFFRDLGRRIVGFVVSEPEEEPSEPEEVEQEALEVEEVEEVEQEEVNLEELADEVVEDVVDEEFEVEEPEEVVEEETNETEEEVVEVEEEIVDVNITDVNITEPDVVVNETVEENVTITNETIVDVNITETNETTVDEAVTNQTTTNETLANETIILGNETSVNITTKQARIVINRPVKWVKKIDFENATNTTGLSLLLPAGAENITIKTGAEAVSAFSEIEEYGEVVESVDREEIVGGGLTGFVSYDLDSSKGILIRLWNWVTGWTMTGNVVTEEEVGEEVIETAEGKVVNVGAVVDFGVEEDVVVEYYTEAPTSVEQEIEGGKRITVSGPDEIGYEDVLAYSELDELIPMSQEIKIRLYWYTEPVEVKEEVEEEVVEVSVNVSENITANVETNTIDVNVTVELGEEEEDVVEEEGVEVGSDEDFGTEQNESSSPLDVEQEEVGNESLSFPDVEVEEETSASEDSLPDSGESESLSLDEVEQDSSDAEIIEEEAEAEGEEEFEQEEVEISLITGGVVSDTELVDEVNQTQDQADLLGGLVRQEIGFEVFDLDGDGFVDYIEWDVEHLSSQVYEVILITKAEHLDENRTFIEDVYEDVREQDGNWTREILPNEFVKVTFEKNLTRERDITIYAKAAENNSVVINETEVPYDIYEKKKRIDEIRGLIENG